MSRLFLLAVATNAVASVCYIGLGSNLANELGTPIDHIHQAIDAFCSSTHFCDVVVSDIYASAPYGVTDQPDFVNAVLKADTNLDPLVLLDFCQSLEKKAKRQRIRHWGERSLDVDILLYGGQVIDHPRLRVPHPELTRRNFVLIPLRQIAPTLVIDGVAIDQIRCANDWTGLTSLKAP